MYVYVCIYNKLVSNFIFLEVITGIAVPKKMAGISRTLCFAHTLMVPPIPFAHFSFLHHLKVYSFAQEILQSRTAFVMAQDKEFGF